METPLQCRFAKRGCGHRDELFKPAYQRVNRARGTKILRCFPHCCPHHIPRSYCGSTIELRVKATPGLVGEQLLVFARFRLRDEPPELRVGDRVALAALTAGVQSPSNTKAPWIQSRRSHASEDDDRRDGNASFAFEINPGRRWYYSWHSSKNSAKRTTKHVLEAYVLARASGDSVRCVAALTSPSFTLVSFRRVSASETALLGEELKDQAVARGPDVTREPLRASLRVLVKDDSDDATRRRHSTPAREGHVDPVGVLFHAAQQCAMGDAKQLIPGWMAMAETSGGQDATAVGRYPFATNTIRNDAQLATHVVGWLLLDATTQSAWRERTRQGARVLLDKRELRACYDRWSRWLTSQVECLLATLEQPPLHELAGILMRDDHSSSLETTATYCFGWSSFVAQARELFTGIACPPFEVVARLRASPAWSCPLERVSVAALEGPNATTPLSSDHARQLAIRRLPATVLFAFWQQLSRPHIDLNTHCAPHELVLASLADDRDVYPAMRLLLDNRPRNCHALPHGEATTGAAACLIRGFGGDYTATLRRDGTVEIDLFTWPTTRGEREACRLRWTFARRDLDGERLEMNLVVSIAELPGETDVASASVREKLARVAAWQDGYKAHLLYTRDL